jgi:hypothetical protein
VAGGLLVLTPTGDRVAGIGTVQDSLGVLSRGHSEYSVDLGPNRRYRGFYGPKTAKALREFQMDVGLPQTGEVDVDTLVWLSRALAEWKFEARMDSTATESGEIEFNLRKEGRDWHATPPDGHEFYVSREVTYKKRYGLMNSHYKKYTQWYDPEASYAQPLGPWRYAMLPTALCESDGLMACINNYDRAYFTFGFYQFAAHVPDGDFVHFLRSLLREVTSAPQYFPDLTLNEEGHLARRVGAALRDLERVEQDMPIDLMRYLNPSDQEVEDAEVLNAARFIHWTETHEEVRRVMLTAAISTAEDKLVQQNRARPLKSTNHPDPLDTLCVAIIDILHHEGSKFAKVDDILKSEKNEDKALVALCNAGVDEGRNKKLLKNIKEMKDQGKLGTQRFSDLLG